MYRYVSFHQQHALLIRQQIGSHKFTFRQTQIIECMGWNVHIDGSRFVGEIHDNKQGLSPRTPLQGGSLFTQECILAVADVLVDVHEVEHLAFGNGRFCA